MMALKRKFDSDIPEGVLTVLKLLQNPPVEEEVLNKVATRSLHELTPSEANNLWISLSENLKAYFKNIFLSRNNGEHDDEEYVLKKIAAYPFMTTLFFLLKMTIQGKAENHIPLTAAHTMLVLSSMLKNLKTDGQVDSEMLEVIALWTEMKLASKETLCFTTFLKRLVHSLGDNATEEDICSVYNLQEWLCINDIRKESWSHILQAMKNKNYLKATRGRSFLSFAMTQDEKLTEDLHRSCKSHLRACSQAESRSYGLIYLQAWRTASVKIKQHIEHCICEMMELAMTLPRKRTEMSPAGLNVLAFLHEFHCRKNCDVIREMLTSKYDLFLWSQLQSPSSSTRCNAAEILADAYPLERARQDHMRNNEYLAKQHSAFSDLLVDTDPSVRNVAVRKICHIASKFWAHVPPSVLQHWISTMILQLAKNLETPEVRQSIYEGLHTLVASPNLPCTKILEQMLPELREQICDDDKKVRIAFVKLLQAIKDAENLELWNIVSLHDLINRLEEDDHEVGELLAQLLCGTRFKCSESSEATVNCIAHMINLSHEATCKFFLHSKSFLKFNDIIKLILLIMECLRKHIEIEMGTKRKHRKNSSQLGPKHLSKKRKGRSKLGKKLIVRMKNVWVKAVRRTGGTEKLDFCSSSSDEDSELFSDLSLTSCSDSNEETEFSRETLLRDPQICRGLIDVLRFLFYVYSTELNRRCSTMKCQKVYRMCKHCIPLFAAYFAGSSAFTSVIALSSFMPAALLRMLKIPPSVEALWLSKMESLSGEDPSCEAVHLASFKCLKDYKPKFLLTAAKIFHAALTLRIAAVSSQSGVLDGKFKRIQYKIESECIVASKILLTSYANLPFPTKNVQHRKHIYDTWKSMEKIKVLVEIRLQQETCFQDPVIVDRFIQECFCCYVKLIQALENSQNTVNFNSMEEYLKLIDWSDRILVNSLPVQCPYANERSHFEWLMMNTTGRLTVSLLNQILEGLLFMMDKGQRCSSFIHKGVRICKKALRTGCRLMFVTSCIKFTSKLYNCFQKNLERNAFFKTLHMLLNLLTDCISSFSDCMPVKDYLKPSIEDYEEVEGAVKTILVTSIKLCGTSTKPIVDVVRKFIEVVLRVMDRGESVVSTSELRDVPELPFIATRFVRLFCSSETLSEIFLVTLMHVINEHCKQAQQLMTGLKLLHVLVLCDKFFKRETLIAAVGKAEAIVGCMQSTVFSGTDRDFVEMVETIVETMKRHLCVT